MVLGAGVAGVTATERLGNAGWKCILWKRLPRSAARSAGAIEAPRGILFHRYAFVEKGNCLKANLCIPTNQNHANIQKDFEAFVPQILDRPSGRNPAFIGNAGACLRSLHLLLHALPEC